MLIARTAELAKKKTYTYDIPLIDAVQLIITLLVIGIVLEVIFDVSFLRVIIAMIILFSLIEVYRTIKNIHAEHEQSVLHHPHHPAHNQNHHHLP